MLGLSVHKNHHVVQLCVAIIYTLLASKNYLWYHDSAEFYGEYSKEIVTFRTELICIQLGVIWLIFVNPEILCGNEDPLWHYDHMSYCYVIT